MTKLFLEVGALAMCALPVLGALDVWSDASIKLGGCPDLNGNGLIDQGEVLDVLHGGDLAHANHQSFATKARSAIPAGYRDDLYATNLLVNCVTEGVERNQDCLYLSQSLKIDETTTPSTTNFYSQSLKLPLKLVGENYSAVIRFRRDLSCPGVQTVFIHLGYDSTGNGVGLMGLLSPDGIITLKAGGSTDAAGEKVLGGNTWVPDPTLEPNNNYSRYHDGTWADFGIVVKGRKVRCYWSPETGPCRWFDADFSDVTLDKMYNDTSSGSLRLGGHKWLGGPMTWENQAKVVIDKGGAFRGAVALFGVWNRCLSDSELVAALANGGPALFRVGVEGRTAEMCGGAETSGAVTLAEGAADLRTASAQLAPGGSLEIPFTVPARNAGLGQLLRLRLASGSAAGEASFCLDGEPLLDKGVGVQPRAWRDVWVGGAALTEGAHTAKIVNSGTTTLAWDVVELAGSFNHQPGLLNGTEKYVPYDSGNGKRQYFGEQEGRAISDAFAADGGWFDFLHSPMPAGVNCETVRPFRLHWTLPARMKRRYAWNLRLVLENAKASCTAKWRVALNGADVMAPRAIGEKETIELPLASAALNWGGDNVLTLTTDDKGETVTSGIVIREVGLVMDQPKATGVLVLLR